MKQAKVIGAIIGVCITLPIWLYLMYKILALVEATELMWFLFWVYVPLVFFIWIVREVPNDKPQT